jgi:enoyl-CoA hydratase
MVGEHPVSRTDDVIVSRHGRAGRITLNRPRALNALTHEMVRAIDAALTAFEDDPEVDIVVVDGAGDRGLCAGGDIRAIYEDARGTRTTSPAFWGDEYRLNAHVAELRKPYVALMDGLVMGGGVGVAAHGSHRLVTDRTALAMPEVRIGLIPDVGGTYLLSRAPEGIGMHLGLTAQTIDGADAIFAGLADDFVPADRLPELLEALATTPCDEAIAAVSELPPPSSLSALSAELRTCYAADSLLAVVAALDELDTAEARAASAAIRGQSPTAVSVAFEAIRRAGALPDLRSALDLEFRAMVCLLGSPDAVEGIRAQVIDKDRAPRWNPASLDAVERVAVEEHFAPLGEFELGLAKTSRLPVSSRSE